MFFIAVCADFRIGLVECVQAVAYVVQEQTGTARHDKDIVCFKELGNDRQGFLFKESGIEFFKDASVSNEVMGYGAELGRGWLCGSDRQFPVELPGIGRNNLGTLVTGDFDRTGGLDRQSTRPNSSH